MYELKKTFTLHSDQLIVFITSIKDRPDRGSEARVVGVWYLGVLQGNGT